MGAGRFCGLSRGWEVGGNKSGVLCGGLLEEPREGVVRGIKGYVWVELFREYQGVWCLGHMQSEVKISIKSKTVTLPVYTVRLESSVYS